MTPRRHSLLARHLIKACGGLSEAALACRLKKSQLSNAQNPSSDVILPADVIVDLEAYCGESIYSRAMVEACAEFSGNGDLVGEAIDLNAQVAALSSHLHHALTDDILSPREADEIGSLVEDIRHALARIDGDLNTAVGGRAGHTKRRKK